MNYLGLSLALEDTSAGGLGLGLVGQVLGGVGEGSQGAGQLALDVTGTGHLQHARPECTALHGTA